MTTPPPTISAPPRPASDRAALDRLVPAGRHPALVYLASLPSPNSRRTMRRALDTIAAILTQDRYDAVTLGAWWGRLRYAETQAVRARLVERYQPATANKLLSALRGVLKAAWRLGYLDAEEYARAADVRSIRGETLPAGRDLAGGEIGALFAACAADTRNPASGARDAALLAVLRAGLRRAEAVMLDAGDFDPASGQLKVRAGKGRKARTVYLDPGAQAAVADWLALRGHADGPLLCPVNKGGRITLRRLSSQAIYNAVKKRGLEAGLADFSPHDFRRTFVGDLLDAGADIVTVAKLAGHANVATTGRYDRRDEGAKRRAAHLLYTPYRTRHTPD